MEIAEVYRWVNQKLVHHISALEVCTYKSIEFMICSVRGTHQTSVLYKINAKANELEMIDVKKG